MSMSEYEKIDELWSVLRNAPRQGMTAKQIAARLEKRKLQNIGSRLSKLAAYGLIERDRVPGVGHVEYAYRMKQREPA